jgi:hypothetical protein
MADAIKQLRLHAHTAIPKPAGKCHGIALRIDGAILGGREQQRGRRSPRGMRKRLAVGRRVGPVECHLGVGSPIGRKS